ncbi:MAG: aminoacyl-tRNA hydrolase [Bacteroidota bacterium]
MKYLIVGLGNIGEEYANTRHNIGFNIADSMAQKQGVSFKMERLAYYTEFRLKNKIVHLIKPTTYMNLSGKALFYWMNELKIPKEQILILVDEIALPFSKIKMKPSGSDGGHNGLKSIQFILNSTIYPRLRFGIGNNYERGKQVDYVLGKWDEAESKELPVLIDKSIQAIESFVLEGLERSMTKYN